MRLCGEKDIAAAIRQHSEAQRAEIERLRVMADEPTTKRVWDGIQAMAGLFADPDHMPTVLEFKAAFDAAFVMDGKPYDVERIKAEWQSDYAAMEARATTAEASLAAMTAERDEAIADWQGANAECHRLAEDAGATECTLERVRGELAASQERERALREAHTNAMGQLNCAIYRARHIAKWHADPNCDVKARAEEVEAHARAAKEVLVAALQTKEDVNGR
ncbi:hypothetical protein TSO5_05580 [Azospirillum sp. TSO5]|nr:hypothetical protein TSO5_05580 [Azospirillum sp. TSO5]